MQQDPVLKVCLAFIVTVATREPEGLPLDSVVSDKVGFSISAKAAIIAAELILRGVLHIDAANNIHLTKEAAEHILPMIEEAKLEHLRAMEGPTQ